jgi:DNA polymerase elongation subunit (family B)
MKFQLITIFYDYNKKYITLNARAENGSAYAIHVLGFEPYFYVKQGEKVDLGNGITHMQRGYKSIFGEDLVRVYTDSPSDVKKRRGDFSRHYEADIPFVRRFLIDKNIYNGFEIDNFDENRTEQTVSVNDVKSCDFVYDNINISYIDIEVDAKNRFPMAEVADRPVTAATVYDEWTKMYITFILDTRNYRKTYSANHEVAGVISEKMLIENVMKYLGSVKPDVISGWNVGWDIDYLYNRGMKLGIRKEVMNYIKFPLMFDMLTAYKKIYGKGSNHLKDVVIEEGVEQYENEIIDGRLLYYGDRENFIKYNKKDVEYCVLLNKKLNMIDYFLDMKRFCGLEDLENTFYHSVKVDVLMLRYARSQKTVLPSRKEEEAEEEPYKGAIVFTPEYGIKENVAVYDMSRFYPSIMLAWHLSPERNDGNGIYQNVIKSLMLIRSKYDNLLDEEIKKSGKNSEKLERIRSMRQVVKGLLNSVYGYSGYPSSRFYDRNIAASITQHARDVISLVKDFTESKGYHVIYGDTDSIMIQIPFDRAEGFADEINAKLNEYCIKEGVDPVLKIKFEKYADRTLFSKIKGSEEGAKKHYGMHVIYEDGSKVDYNIIKGYDRHDSSKVGRTIRKEVLNMILKGAKDSVMNYVKDEKRKIRSGIYRLNDIAINVSLSKNVEDYDSNTAYVRGAKYANKNLGLDIQTGDNLKMFYVIKDNNINTDIICVFDEKQVPQGAKIDWEKMIDVTVTKKLDTILDSAGITADTISINKFF